MAASGMSVAMSVLFGHGIMRTEASGEVEEFESILCLPQARAPADHLVFRRWFQALLLMVSVGAVALRIGGTLDGRTFEVPIAVPGIFDALLLVQCRRSVQRQFAMQLARLSDIERDLDAVFDGSDSQQSGAPGKRET